MFRFAPFANNIFRLFVDLKLIETTRRSSPPVSPILDVMLICNVNVKKLPMPNGALLVEALDATLLCCAPT